MPYENINNFQVYYEIHGEGEETIVLLHHGFGCLKIWKAIYPKLVSAGFRVVMYDRRGFGRTEGGDDFQEFWEDPERPRVEAVAELRALKERFGIGKCHLIGQCEGGVIAIDYAVEYPEDVLTVTTSSTQCYGDMTMEELTKAKFIQDYTMLDPKLQLKMIDWHGEKAQVRYEQFAKYGGQYGKDRFDLRPQLPRVTCPSLVLYPDRSAIFDVEQAITFYRLLPKGELAVFPKCGHNTYDQRPEDYIRTVLDFIKRHQAGGESKERLATNCLA